MTSCPALASRRATSAHVPPASRKPCSRSTETPVGSARSSQNRWRKRRIPLTSTYPESAFTALPVSDLHAPGEHHVDPALRSGDLRGVAKDLGSVERGVDVGI